MSGIWIITSISRRGPGQEEVGAEGQGSGNGETCWSLREKDAELEGDKYAWGLRTCGRREELEDGWILDATLERLFHYSLPDINQQSGGRGGRQQCGEGEGGGKITGGAHSGIELVFPVLCLPPGNKFGSCYFSLAPLPACKPLAPSS